MVVITSGEYADVVIPQQPGESYSAYLNRLAGYPSVKGTDYLTPGASPGSVIFTPITPTTPGSLPAPWLPTYPAVKGVDYVTPPSYTPPPGTIPFVPTPTPGTGNPWYPTGTNPSAPAGRVLTAIPYINHVAAAVLVGGEVLGGVISAAAQGFGGSSNLLKVVSGIIGAIK